MGESNTPIAIFGIIALIIITFFILVIFNVISVPGIEIENTDSVPIQHSFYVVEESVIVEEQIVDLRLVSLPYLTATDVQATCIAAGGIWHNEADFVGCEGFGPVDCNTALVVSAMTQCIGAGGDWTCSHDGIYCSI